KSSPATLNWCASGRMAAIVPAVFRKVRREDPPPKRDVFTVMIVIYIVPASSNRALIYKFLSKFAGVPASSCPIGTLANQQFGLQDNFFGLMLVIISLFEQFEKESCHLFAHLDGVLVYRRYGGADQTRERLVCESHYTNLFW